MTKSLRYRFCPCCDEEISFQHDAKIVTCPNPNCCKQFSIDYDADYRNGRYVSMIGLTEITHLDGKGEK